MLNRQLLRIADDIVQLINSPSQDNMNLSELVERTIGNFRKIYDSIKIDTSIPEDIRVNNPKVYSKVLYSLIENAVLSSNEKGSEKVNIIFDALTKSLQIVNKGNFPNDWLMDSGKPYIDIPSSREFGSGFGIGNCVGMLDGINKNLTYVNHEGEVYTIIQLDINDQKKSQLNFNLDKKPKVLFLDYTNGHRFPGIEKTIQLLNPNFEYTWSRDLNMGSRKIKELPIEDYFLVVMHPDLPTSAERDGEIEPRTNLIQFFSPKIINRNPYIRFGFVTGFNDMTSIVNRQYDSMIRKLKKREISSLKRTSFDNAIDFVTESYSSSDELNMMIENSYLKHRLTLQK